MTLGRTISTILVAGGLAIGSGAAFADEDHYKLTQLNLANYDSIIHNGKPTIVDIDTTWCKPCHKLKPELKKLENIFGDYFDIVQLTQDANYMNADVVKDENGDNVNDDYEEIAKRLGVFDKNGVPLLVFVAGEKISTELGYKDISELYPLLETNLGIDIDKDAIKARLTRDYLIRNDLPLNQEYAEWLDLGDVIYLTDEDLSCGGVPPARANLYDSKRYSGKDIAFFNKGNIPSYKANECPESMDATECAYNVLTGGSHERWDKRDAAEFIEACVPWDELEMYHESFRRDQIINFWRADVFPEIANDHVGKSTREILSHGNIEKIRKNNGF